MAQQVYAVIIDSTNSGEYENAADVVLFTTYYLARRYIENAFVDTCDNMGIDHARIPELFKWYDNTAQFRKDGVIIDWKIEKMPVLEEV